MAPIKSSVLREAQDSDSFSQGIKQLIKEKKMKSDRYLLVNGIIHKIIVHEGIIHSPILVPESSEAMPYRSSLIAGACGTEMLVWISEKKILLKKHGW